MRCDLVPAEHSKDACLRNRRHRDFLAASYNVSLFVGGIGHQLADTIIGDVLDHLHPEQRAVAARDQPSEHSHCAMGATNGPGKRPKSLRVSHAVVRNYTGQRETGNQ